MNERSATRQVKGNGAASPDDLERDLARTRAELNDTLDAITHRLSPGQLVDQFFDYFETGPGEYAKNLGAQVRDNPVPATLTAIGIGWLIYNSRNPPAYRYGGYREEEYTSEGIPESGPSASMHEMGGRISEKASEMKSRVGRHMGETRESMAKASDSMKQRAHSMAEGMRHRREDIAHGIRRSSEATRDTFSEMMHEQPLVVGLLGIAVGLGLGAALPSTRRERETFGPKRDEMMHRVRDTGREQMEKTREELKGAVSESSTPRPSTH
jgi:hypothetical protein